MSLILPITFFIKQFIYIAYQNCINVRTKVQYINTCNKVQYPKFNKSKVKEAEANDNIYHGVRSKTITRRTKPVGQDHGVSKFFVLFSFDVEIVIKRLNK